MCQVTSCTQCLNVFHLAMEHRTERLSDAEARCRAELAQYCEEIGVRKNSCRVCANKLDKMLGELEQQFETAKSNLAQIHETYVAMLEKKRDQVVEELGNLHSKQVGITSFSQPSKSRTGREKSGKVRECIHNLTHIRFFILGQFHSSSVGILLKFSVYSEYYCVKCFWQLFA